MGVGPPGPPESARPAFRGAAELAERLGLPERSIGMSGDLEVAVSEGATIVRLGSALFGARPPRSATWWSRRAGQGDAERAAGSAELTGPTESATRPHGASRAGR